MIALVIGGLWSGCTTPEQQPRSETSVETKTSDQIPSTEEDTERRIEALARFATGVSKELQNKGDLALEDFYKSVQADPDNESLAIDVARRFLRKRENDKAIEVLENATKNGEGSALALAMLGLAYAQQNEHDKAIMACERSLAKQPNSIVPYRTLYQVHMTRQKADAALATLQKAATATNASGLFLIDLGELMVAHLRAHPTVRESTMPVLKDVLKRAVAIKPRNAILVARLADSLQFADEPKQAAELYLGLLGRSPNSIAFRQRLIDIYLRSNDKKGAILQLETILKEQPTNAQANYFLGVIAAEDNEWKKAIENYRRTIQFNESFEPVYYDLAGALINNDKPDDAISVITAARKKFKAKFTMEFYSALAHGRKKAYGEAVKHYTAEELIAKRDEPERLTHFFYFQAGAAYERNKDFEQAARYFTKSLEIKPDFAEAMNYLGYMWAERGENLDKAKELIEKAVTAEPENAAFLDSMGWVLFQMGKAHESLPWLLKSIENTSVEKEDDPTLFEHLGDVYFKLDDLRNARVQYEKAVKIEAKPEIVKKLNAVQERLRKTP